MTAEEDRPDRLVVRRVIPAPREEVFAAWVDPESLRHWMCPGDVLTAEAHLDPRVGGAYRIVMKSPTREYDHTGEYLVVDPPSKLVFTWTSTGTDNRPTLVTIDLTARGDGCELVLTHERFPSAETMQRHKGGWGQIVERLAGHLQQKTGSRGSRGET
jgi:uncharacterized protein YndB with AHSA1/START domain